MKNLLIIWSILSSLSLTAMSQGVVVPANGPAPTLTSITVNNGTGDQSDPHVSGDWLTYTSDVSIRYYNFATNIDAEIPMGASSLDLLSDINGSKIVFSRYISGVRTAVMVFDAATPLVAPLEIDTAPGTLRLGSAIGGNTVAYIDFGLQANGELVVHDLTTSSSVRITNDGNPDQMPQVSPDGSVVTWEHCNASLSNCDIWQAVRTGLVWNVSVASNSANPEANPDTNGTLVVNDSTFPAGSGVFLSSNNGTSWTTVSTGLTNTFVTSLAVSGSNLFAGTLGGVFRSADNGTSWTAVNTGMTGTIVRALAVSGSNLFAGTYDGGVFRSSDNGNSWTAVNTGLTNTYVIALGVSGSNLFAGTVGSGVFLSTDNGTSWTAVNTGLTNAFVTAFGVSGSNLFAATQGGGVFLSTDNGTSWTAVGLATSNVYSLTAIGSNLFAGAYGTSGSGVFRSTDNGASWTEVNTGLTNTSVFALTASGTNLFAGTEGSGVFLSPNNGASWTAVNAGMTGTGVRAIALNGLDLFAGSSGGSTADLFWRPVTGGTGVQLQIAGIEGNPSISGNFIAFESRSNPTAANDLFIYDIIRNLLYRITDTPLVTEQLNDITMLPNCDLRVVWASDEDGSSARNVKAATFSVGGCGDNTPPVLNEPIPNVVTLLPLNSSATSMAVTFPTPTATDDSGTVTVTTNPVSGSVFALGTTTVNVTATDGAGNIDTGSFTVTVLHNFSGFLQPVDELPTVNLVSAGQAVPVKFSLSGNKGLSIFTAGYPASSAVLCDATEPGSVIEETISAGGSSLSYNATADVYSYVWKTNKAWKGTCRMLVLRLSDGSSYFAKFRFR